MSVVAVPDPAPVVTVGLGDIDAELLDAVPWSERRLAERIGVATRHRLPEGTWRPGEMLVRGRPLPHAVVVINGLIVRDVAVAGRASGHVFGPGDVLRPWRPPQTAFATRTLWACGTGGAEVAVLDDRFARAAWKWPGVSRVIQERLAEQLDATALQAAIVSLPRAEQRVLAVLWQLADRWGTVRPEGVLVGVELTHELLGRLAGARRPTVSLALQMLVDEGLLSRTVAGGLCLAHGSQAKLEQPAA